MGNSSEIFVVIVVLNVIEVHYKLMLGTWLLNKVFRHQPVNQESIVTILGTNSNARIVGNRPMLQESAFFWFCGETNHAPMIGECICVSLWRFFYREYNIFFFRIKLQLFCNCHSK